MAKPALPINTSPKTDAELRSVLNRLSRSTVTLVTDLVSLEDAFLRNGTAAGAVTAGNVLYAPVTGSVNLARANVASTSVVIGIALNAAGVGQNVLYLTLGVVTLAALTAGSVYYLSAVTPGAIVTVPDATAGQYIVPVGRAIETTKLLFSPLTTILL